MGAGGLGNGDVEPLISPDEQSCAVGNLDHELAIIGLEHLRDRETGRESSQSSNEIVLTSFAFA